ncbi:hypothetical protein ABIC09_004965 [Bradyrhizobium sp. S3.12.5]|uniref:hypothetical protein n=1 Tax=Bradyrhizobium sp. S3.12.5 TaxID=3156386 RepID=UPI0033959A59
MKYILFMILLVTSPGQSIPKKERVYALQSMQTVEFDSPDACKTAQGEIKASLDITDTIIMVSRCLRKGDEPSADAAEQKPETNLFQKNSTEQTIKNFREQSTEGKPESTDKKPESGEKAPPAAAAKKSYPPVIRFSTF